MGKYTGKRIGGFALGVGVHEVGAYVVSKSQSPVRDSFIFLGADAALSLALLIPKSSRTVGKWFLLGAGVDLLLGAIVGYFRADKGRGPQGGFAEIAHHLLGEGQYTYDVSDDIAQAMISGALGHRFY